MNDIKNAIDYIRMAEYPVNEAVSDYIPQSVITTVTGWFEKINSALAPKVEQARKSGKAKKPPNTSIFKKALEISPAFGNSLISMATSMYALSYSFPEAIDAYENGEYTKAFASFLQGAGLLIPQLRIPTTIVTMLPTVLGFVMRTVADFSTEEEDMLTTLAQQASQYPDDPDAIQFLKTYQAIFGDLE